MAVLATSVAFASCTFFDFPLKFDNPIDPSATFARTRQVGEPEFADGRGMRWINDMDVAPDGQSLLVVTGNPELGMAVVDIAIGTFTWWKPDDTQPGAICVDPARNVLYVASGSAIKARTFGAGDATTVIQAEWNNERLSFYTITLAPDGTIAAIARRDWWPPNGTGGSSTALCIISPQGDIETMVDIGNYGIGDVAASNDRIFCTTGGFIEIFDRATGLPLSSISRDDATGEIVSRARPDPPLSSFNASSLCFIPGTSTLVCGLGSPEGDGTGCYLLNVDAVLPLVGRVTAFSGTPNPRIAVAADCTVYAAQSDPGVIANLTAGSQVFANPARRPGEFRDITQCIAQPNGTLLILDRGLLAIDTYDPATQTFTRLSLPATDPERTSGPNLMSPAESGFYLAEDRRVIRCDASGNTLESWSVASLAPNYGGRLVRCLVAEAHGQAIAVVAPEGEGGARVALYAMRTGNPTPVPWVVAGLPVLGTDLSAAAIAVDADGRRLLLAISKLGGPAYWGYVGVDPSGDGRFTAAWSSTDDPSFVDPNVASRTRIYSVAPGRACVWMSFIDLNTIGRFSTDGTVLGSIDSGGSQWTADTIRDSGGWWWGSWPTLSVDTSGWLWTAQGGAAVFGVTPQ